MWKRRRRKAKKQRPEKKARKVSDFVIEESYISSSRSREVVVVEKAALFVPIALLVYIALHSLACLSFGGGGAGWTRALAVWLKNSAAAAVHSNPAAPAMFGWLKTPAALTLYSGGEA